jgi:hypothetical protein
VIQTNPKHPAGPPMTLGNMRATGLETRSTNERRVVKLPKRPKEDTAAEAIRMGSTNDKRASVGQPFIFARLDTGVDFYFLAFFAFFLFTIVSSFCSDIGNSEVCLEPINGPNPFNSKSRDLFHTMVNKVEVLS